MGSFAQPAEAVQRGLIDEIVPEGKLSEYSAKVASQLAAIPSTPFALTKRLLRRPAVERAESAQPKLDQQVVAIWESDETHEIIRKYLERTIGKG